ncbi:UDP-glucuronosyltransferase-like [Belonocnema kinseyi]|uniref:UDP-glucuronosyltransferase-like n=1 Tax=Belonocnema kinseyi TaxID=2817044 RepID=UPI00143D1099|nr:UDP-glucuronosyltransferase-like [Belonocnema kinseyi]
MSTSYWYIVILIFFLRREVDTYRVLGVFPLNFRSHFIFFESIMRGLAREGHQVDIISHYELTNPPKNYKTIINLAKLDYPYPTTKFETIQKAIDAIKDPVKHLTEVYGIKMCPLLGHQKMQDFIRKPPKDTPYDVIIVQGYTISCFNGLGRVFNVPVITATPTLEFPWISRQIGNPFSTAFFSTLFMMKAEIKTFWDRLHNTVQTHVALYRFFSRTDDTHTEAMRKFLSTDMPTIREIEKEVALSIVNSHYTLQGVRPNTPAIIEVAGIHIEEDNSTLNMDLKRWMDESKSGVVYISFGTVVPIESLSKTTLLGMYNSFSKIAPIRVLIKAAEGENLPLGLPKNVKTMTWIPQIAVLKHNNTRLFMTHGGVHGVQEAVYFGIPVIGVPLFFDQMKNVNILVSKKMGVQLNYNEITEDSLDAALGKILKNPKYREAANYQSRLFRDRPLSATKTATYWIEYILKHGAQSLRSPAIDLYWWQAELLDVYLFLLFCVSLVSYVISIIFNIVLRKLSRRNLKIQLKRD